MSDGTAQFEALPTPFSAWQWLGVEQQLVPRWVVESFSGFRVVRVAGTNRLELMRETPPAVASLGPGDWLLIDSERQFRVESHEGLARWYRRVSES